MKHVSLTKQPDDPRAAKGTSIWAEEVKFKMQLYDGLTVD